MKKIWRILILSGVIVAIAVAGGVEYLNQVYLPSKGRRWVEISLSEALGRKVSVGAIRVHLWHGVLLEKIVVSEENPVGNLPFFQADQISGKILYLPFLKKRELIIPSLEIVRPRCRLVQNSKGVWNFQSLSIFKPKIPSSPSRWKTAVMALALKEGSLEAIASTSSSKVILQLEQIDTRAHLSLASQILFSLQTQLAGNKSSRITFDGTYDLHSKQLHLNHELTINLETIRDYLPKEMASSLKLLEGNATLRLQIAGDFKKPWSLYGEFETKKLAWKIRLLAKEVIEGHGDIHCRMQGEPSSLQMDNLRQALTGTADLDHVTIKPIPTIGELRDWTGQLQIDTKGIRAEKMTATLPSGEILTIQGSIANNEEKSFLFHTTTSCALDHLPPLPQVDALLKNWTLSGQATMEAMGEGHLQPTFSVQPTLLISLEKASAQSRTMDLSFKTMDGLVRWQPDLLTVTKLHGEYLGQPFHMQGSLVHFAQPEIDAQFSWGTLVSDVELVIEGERIRVRNFSGHYGNASFHIFGEIHSWKDCVGNLYGETEFQCEDWVKKLPLKGKVTTKWLLQGPLSRPSEWDLDVKAHSPRMVYQEIPLEELRSEIRYKEGLMNLSLLKASLDDGTCSLTGQWSLNDPKNPWKGSLTLSTVALDALAHQLNWKTSTISGKLSLTCQAKGSGAALSTYQGGGHIMITGGQIMELPFFGSFADFIKIPTLRSIHFNDGRGNFTFGEGTLQSDDLQLSAPQQATLTIMGSGGFLDGVNSPINWTIVPTFAPELIPKESRSKIGRAIAHGTSYFVGEIRMTGTWKNPKRKFIPKPLTQILNEQLFNVQDLWKDLF